MTYWRSLKKVGVNYLIYLPQILQSYTNKSTISHHKPLTTTIATFSVVVEAVTSTTTASPSSSLVAPSPSTTASVAPTEILRNTKGFTIQFTLLPPRMPVTENTKKRRFYVTQYCELSRIIDAKILRLLHTVSSQCKTVLVSCLKKA